jgi:hypothetical protein
MEAWRRMARVGQGNRQPAALTDGNDATTEQGMVP